MKRRRVMDTLSTLIDDNYREILISDRESD